MEDKVKKPIIDVLIRPLQSFMKHEQSGGIVLGLSVVLALILANSSWSDNYFQLLRNEVGFQFNDISFLKYSLQLWVNNGLMAIFFFVVGLELKREFVAGELASPKKALLPIGAAIGGMLVPALIYFSLNPTGEVSAGWGIPMATDIAFARSVMYLLGKRVPPSLKVFLMALAIVDDLGAVLVIAFFYTSDISVQYLLIGLGFVVLMILGNKMGIRNIWFYAILGIGGVWLAFLLSGVNATIAAVLAAFTIPADVSIKENVYIKRVKQSINKFSAITPMEGPILSAEQLDVLETVKKDTNCEIPLLQRLEYAIQPFVTFFVLPVFALANAGVSLTVDAQELFSSNVLLGVGLGLLAGKVIGIVGFTYLLVKLKIAAYPSGMNMKNLIGTSFLGSIGFTMSIFITSLAFTSEIYITQAKIGIFLASILGGVIGYIVLRLVNRST